MRPWDDENITWGKGRIFWQGGKAPHLKDTCSPSLDDDFDYHNFHSSFEDFDYHYKGIKIL